MSQLPSESPGLTAQPKLRSMVRDSQLKPGLLLVIVVVLALGAWVVNKAAFYSPAAARAQSAAPAASPQVIVVTATPEPTPIVQLVTVTVPGPVVSVPVTVTVPGPTVSVPVEVERLVPVTVTQIVEARPWESLVVPGRAAAICIYGQALTGIYLDDKGIVDGCHQVWLPSPATNIEVTVTR